MGFNRCLVATTGNDYRWVMCNDLLTVVALLPCNLGLCRVTLHDIVPGEAIALLGSSLVSTYICLVT
jgi:hypothetical protein